MNAPEQTSEVSAVRDTQEANLERVHTKISPLVHAFCLDVYGDAARPLPQFHMVELTAYVRRRSAGLAPDSAGRILRDLRAKKRIDYKIVNRRASLYQLLLVTR